MNRLEKKVAIITGAASGIGFGIAQLFAEESAQVILTDLNEELLNQRCGELIEKGLNVTACKHDVGNPESWQEVADQVEQDIGRLDILVNNAGIAATGTIEDTTLEDWNHLLRINLDGTFLGCQHAIRLMKPNGGGSIINISSIAALKASLVGPAYGASKAAIWNLTRTVALYCGKSGYNIRCNSIHPGVTETALLEAADEKMVEQFMSQIPMGKLGKPLDMAYAALYLASDEAAFTTGTSLVVDGGALS